MQFFFPSPRRMRLVHAMLFLSATSMLGACHDNPAAPVPSVRGIVTVSATGLPVAGVKVSLGDANTITGTDGRFELSGLVLGPAKIRGTATGYEAFETDVTVTDGPVTQDIALKRIELFQFSNFALYVPASVTQVRAVLVTLGGPDTRGFAAGTPFGAPFPPVEASLQTLGQQLRALGASKGLAIIGTSQAAMPNTAASDGIIAQAIQQASALSGREDLNNAPFLVYGLSGGGPEAAGFAARNASRVAGVLFKAPLRVETLTTGPALGVPTYILLAELDAFVNNVALTTSYRANRATGAPWALALERGVPHHALSPAQRDLTVNWMTAILGMRLGASATEALRAVVESSGWVGDPASSQVSPWSGYSGNPLAASWFPSQPIAEEWRTFIRIGAP